MKRLFLSIFIIIALAFRGFAQDESIYRFFYVAQSGLSEKVKLSNILLEAYESAIENEWNSVFYLANVNHPHIASVHDPESEFNAIIAEIQNSNGRDVRPSTDAQLILDYLATNPYFDEDGNVKDQYDQVYFTFYVNSEFWNNNGNRDLIAALYEALDVINNPKIRFEVRMSRTDRREGQMIYDEANPFGLIAPKTMSRDFEIIGY